MSQNWEKSLLQLPRAQNDIFSSPKPKDFEFTMIYKEKTNLCILKADTRKCSAFFHYFSLKNDIDYQNYFSVVK